MDFPQERIEEIFSLFSGCASSEEKVHRVIDLGRALPSFPDEWKIEENIVPGCQSIVYLHSTVEKDKIFFHAHSEALISAGLAALLLRAYNSVSPEVILKCKPSFLEELGIYASLTPGRSNGLSSMILTMQKHALNILIS